MIKILYFARFREKLGLDQEQYPTTFPLTVTELLQQLAQRGGHWHDLFDCPQGVLVAVNQEMTTQQAIITVGDEVAFFPPVTGG
ncbi:molybdopterin converting factor subunit 1 [Agitococcus lubricus]|uniref:Molybdopterin synthase sulfur carrier subunit n=1 Tax=Agitococcus lubricus TaxID=1077255 RepID=A0A2T5IYV8_9GAMM|nr:molybdopterin converting factor subunit 1 [Agitococcus lubricus]PTQ89193.1 molybdopterin synthase subunit MoaD [Agitococcus lubricus]